MSSISSTSSKSGEGRAARKKRVRHWTSTDRARHRVIEKERREAFNERLLELASLLPALNDCRPSQLSKHVIVHESIKQHNAHKDAALLADQNLAAINTERDVLLEEVNQWRMLNGMEPFMPGAYANSVSDGSRNTTGSLPVGTSSTAAQHRTGFHGPAYEIVAESRSAVHPFYPARDFSIQQPPQFNLTTPEAVPLSRPMVFHEDGAEVLKLGQSSNEQSQPAMDFYAQQSMGQCLPYTLPTS